ncbi:hypothetical protein INS49_006003 [Diaporthe citri]|uniref:uncharacterized protein n=1 Tax=Diaporthe citri TaxID=83186 RepID=UPI001C7FE826|nr:uncharacterized protein INS49_006003 [Diaporthe citri]KAG6364402.1 hypothetical protein INS49_006003 [Diaporthe citri]
MAPSQEETGLQLHKLDGKHNYVRFRQNFDRVLKKKDPEVCNATPETVKSEKARQAVETIGRSPTRSLKSMIATLRTRILMVNIMSQHELSRYENTTTVFIMRGLRIREATGIEKIGSVERGLTIFVLGEMAADLHGLIVGIRQPKGFVFHEIGSTIRFNVRSREFKGNNHISPAPKATLTDDDDYNDDEEEPQIHLTGRAQEGKDRHRGNAPAPYRAPRTTAPGVKSDYNEDEDESPRRRRPRFAATSATIINDETIAALLSERLATSIRQDASAKVFSTNNELQLIAQPSSSMQAPTAKFSTTRSFSPNSS